MERQWRKIECFIDGVLFRKHLAANLKIANNIKEHVDNYLKKRGYIFASCVDPDPLDGLPRVVIRIRVKTKDFDELLALWDKLCDIGYQGLSSDEAIDIYIDCEQLAE